MKFQVGEIAVYVGLYNIPEDNGMEVEIVRVGPIYYGEPSVTGTCRFGNSAYKSVDYEVREPSGAVGFVLVHNLRKRQPPDEQSYIPESIRRLFGQPVSA